MASKLSAMKRWICLLVLATPLWLQAQQKPQLTGIVTSEAGESLAGVIIHVAAADDKEKQTFTSNDKGTFAINGLKAGNRYQFSFSTLGFEPYVVSNFLIKQGASHSLIIRMRESASNLKELVIIGYGQVMKKDLTGAIATVKSDKIAEIAVTDVTQAIQGRVAGVMAQTTSWKPGVPNQVRIRGSRSITASNDALYVVDGTPMVDGVDLINPNDIESINVLKDASATAIYGNRGANGVIIITTKKGKQGKTTIDYNGYYGIQENQPLPELMGAADFVEYSREAQRNSLGGTYDNKPNRDLDFKNEQLVATPYMRKNMENAWASGSYDASKLVGMDWLSFGLRNGSMQDHQLSVRGGNDRTRVLLSGDYFKNTGVVRDQDYTRYSARVNADHSASDAIKMGTQSVFTHSEQNAGWDDVFDGYGLKSFNPLASPYEEDGTTLALFPTNNTRTPNPVTNFGVTKRVVKQDRFMGNYYADISFLKGFNFRSNIGIDYRAGQSLNFNKKNTAAAGGQAPSATSNGGYKKFMYNWENILSYRKTIRRDHSLYATLVQSIQAETAERYGISVSNLPYDEQLYYNVGSALTINSLGSNYTKWALASFMGRINYGFQDRFLLTASVRYDGSSRLATGNQWVAYPSVAMAWRLKNESFLKNTSAVSELKIRGGWGKTGNTSIDPYTTWGRLDIIRYPFGETGTLGFAPAAMANPYLTWETTSQYNAGIDFGFLNGRVTGSIDVYQQKTSNLLLDYQLPTVSGFKKIISNVGKTSNKGIELAINTVNIERKKFRWSTDWIFATNKQEIVELYNGKHDDIANGWFIGKPNKVYYDLSFDGIWQNTDADKAEMALFNANGGTFKPGDIKPKDINNDHRIDAADRHIIGQEDPKWTASVGNNIQYGNFDASVFVYANVGQTLNHDLDMRFDGRYNQPKLDYWTPTNPSNRYPRPLLGTADLPYLGTLDYYSGSFMRIKNISIGYSLPVNTLKSLSLQRFRVYASVQNPFVITQFPGTDPEGGTGFNEPSVTTYLLGVNLSF